MTPPIAPEKNKEAVEIDQTAILDVAARVAQRLAKVKISKTRAALQAGLGRDVIRDMFRRSEQSPTLRTIVALAPVLGVSPEWLAFGVGRVLDEIDDDRLARTIPVKGLVGVGAVVEEIGRPPEVGLPESVELPRCGEVEAFIVRGESQWPRLLDGEIVLCGPKVEKIGELVDQMAIVQTLDGRRLIKTIRRAVGDDVWTLESQRGRAEVNIKLLGAWRYLGLLPGSPATRSRERTETEDS